MWTMAKTGILILTVVTFIFNQRVCEAEIAHTPRMNNVPYSEVVKPYHDLYGVSAINKCVWLSGYNGLIAHSCDGGKSWEKQKSGVKVPLFDVYFIDPLCGWCVGDKGTILKTMDGGKKWESQESPTTVELMKVFFKDHNVGFILGNEVVLSTTNSGRSWEIKISGIENIFYDIHFVDSVGYIVGEFGKVFKTTDSGETWVAMGPVDKEEARSMFSTYFRSPEEGFAVGMGTSIYYTNDGAKSWRKIETKAAYTLLKVFPLGEEYFFAGLRGSFFAGSIHTSNEAVINYKNISIPDVTVWICDLDFADKGRGFAIGGNGLLLKTTDAGKNWSVVK